MAGDDDSAIPPQNLLYPVYTVTNIQDKVLVLDGQKVTYPTWKRLFQLHAKAYQVLHHIDGTPKPTSPTELALWDEIDAHVLLWIYGTLTQDLLARVLVDEDESSTAYEAWNRVKNIFDNTILVSRKKTRWSRSVPHEIMMEILSWLPVRTVARLKCVSKTFLNMILSPEFFRLHLGRGSRIQNSNNLTLIRLGDAFMYSFDFNQPQRPAVLLRMHPKVVDLLHLEQDPYHSDGLTKNEIHRPKILGLINGVLCFRNSSNEFVLYNPVTRAYKQVPRRPYMWSGTYPDEFVYDCVSDDIKIFCFSATYFPWMNPDDPTAYTFHLYSLKENSWSTTIGKSRLGSPRGLNEESCHDIATHSVYWITGFPRNHPGPSKVITRFDVSSYEYEEMIAFPSQVDPKNRHVRLEVLNKQLHVLAHDENKCSISILVMEDGCWTQLFHCSDPEYQSLHFRSPAAYNSSRCYACYAKPYAYSKDRRKIFVGLEQRLKYFICCDLESQSSSVVQVDGLPEGLSTFTTPMPWTPSLVPLA